MKTKLTLLLFCFFLLGLGPTQARACEDIQVLFNNGQFAEAVIEGRDLGTAEGYVLAARSQLVLILYLTSPAERDGAINQAIRDGEAALALDNGNVEAMVNLGVAFGLRGKEEQSISDGKRSRDLLKKAVQMAPDNSWAIGALASWHAETVYQAGRLPASIIFGADRKSARSLFARAVLADPENLTIRAGYVRALLKLDENNRKDLKKDTALINENIAYILKSEPANALEEIVKLQIREIKTALDNGDGQRLKMLLEGAQAPQSP